MNMFQSITIIICRSNANAVKVWFESEDIVLDEHGLSQLVILID